MDNKTVNFTIDGVDMQGKPGQTILEAADAAGIYIPRLCAMKGLSPNGSCRVCTVMVNSRPQTACTFPIAEGMDVENDTEKLRTMRRDIIDMLFVEGNHFCMFCEKSGNCELQALAYRFGICAPKYPYLFPKCGPVDASHPDVFIDRNRCILCGRCVSASIEQDGKNVFGFAARGPHKRVTVNSDSGLDKTDLAVADKAAASCPVGAIVRKRVGFAAPVGQRAYDCAPIGSEIEAAKPSSGTNQ